MSADTNSVYYSNVCTRREATQTQQTQCQHLVGNSNIICVSWLCSKHMEYIVLLKFLSMTPRTRGNHTTCLNNLSIGVIIFERY